MGFLKRYFAPQSDDYAVRSVVLGAALKEHNLRIIILLLSAGWACFIILQVKGQGQSWPTYPHSTLNKFKGLQDFTGAVTGQSIT